ncbi:MAG: urease accessory protein UreE, partial [Eubacteriaceae bacterium]
GIRLGDDVLKHGMKQDDVLYADADRVIAVNIPPCEVVVATVAEDHPHMKEKLCYEIGNRHAPLFWGPDDNTFITPYNEPMLLMLDKLHGVTARKESRKLDFDRAISSSVHSHTHSH